jgi:hypothetical protein
MSRFRSWGSIARVVVGASVFGGVTGCYSYAYQARGTDPDLQRLASELKPHTDVRWSMWWGGHQDEWSPVECVENGSQKCVQVPQCDKGISRVEVSYTGATFIMTILTLGIAVPMEVKAWCSADSGPRHGP